MITCCIRYTLDPHRRFDFEEYARRWPPIIKRCGGDLVGYFLPKEGANNFALALIDEAKANVGHAGKTQCILVEDRTFLERA
jgi:hypothetical protein